VAFSATEPVPVTHKGDTAVFRIPAVKKPAIIESTFYEIVRKPTNEAPPM
jgi:hypothetical protein